jgi:hypothetical protein
MSLDVGEGDPVGEIKPVSKTFPSALRQRQSKSPCLFPSLPSLPATLCRRSLVQYSEARVQKGERGAHFGLTPDLNVLTNAMRIRVACRAKRDQVGLCIVARLATQFVVVNFQVQDRATTLTPPAVSA